VYLANFETWLKHWQPGKPREKRSHSGGHEPHPAPAE
jgi:hypothetical protein